MKSVFDENGRYRSESTEYAEKLENGASLVSVIDGMDKDGFSWDAITYLVHASTDWILCNKHMHKECEKAAKELHEAHGKDR